MVQHHYYHYYYFCILEEHSSSVLNSLQYCFNFLSADFFLKINFFENTIRMSNSLDPVQARRYDSSGLIWVQTVCQGYQQTTIVDIKRVNFRVQNTANPLHRMQRRMISVVIFFVFLDYYFLLYCCYMYCPSARCGNYISPFLCANSIWKSFLKYE